MISRLKRNQKDAQGIDRAVERNQKLMRRALAGLSIIDANALSSAGNKMWEQQEYDRAAAAAEDPGPVYKHACVSVILCITDPRFAV